MIERDTEQGHAGEGHPPDPPRVLSLSESAERLGMKRSNVAKFLARRSVEPAFAKAQGYFWWEADIDRVKAEREADKERMASDARRREAAMRARAEVERRPVPSELSRLGHTQRELLGEMLRRPALSQTDATRLALRRLEGRGLVEQVVGAEKLFQLTVEGRKAAGLL